MLTVVKLPISHDSRHLSGLLTDLLDSNETGPWKGLARSSSPPTGPPVRGWEFGDEGSSWHRYTNIVVEPVFFFLSSTSKPPIWIA